MTLTRPDISFPVNRVCQFLHSTTTVHWEEVKTILQYVKGTVSLGLKIRRSDSLFVSAFSDAEYKALANATAEIMWIRKLLDELRIPHPCAACL